MVLGSLLAGGKLKIIVTALGLITASIGGAFALGVLGAPSVVGVENRFGPVSDETTVVETDLVVNNPNPIGIRLGDTTVNYTVSMNDVGIAAGQKKGLAVDRGNTTLAFTTRMENEKIPPWWVSHVRNGEVTNVTVDADVQTSVLGDRTFELQQNQRVETDIISQFNSNETRPVEGPSSPLYSNPVLYINETSAEWGSVSTEETPIDMAFTVYNPKLQPYTISEVGYEVTMNGIAVGEGATDQSYVIPGNAQETIRTTPVIQNRRLDEWWVSHLERNQMTQLRIDFYAKVELPTGTEIRVPLDQLTYEKSIETDIFGTKNESDRSAGANGGPTTPTATPTATSSGSSPVDSPISTPTGSPLPTDGTSSSPTDGLLRVAAPSRSPIPF